MKPYYEEGGIVIYHGDCREILPTLPKVDLVLTDPPYGTQNLGGGYGRRQIHSKDGRLGQTIQNDSDLTAIEQASPLLFERLQADAWAVTFCGPRRMLDAGQIMRCAGFEFYGHCVWDKGAPGLGYTIRYSHEDALIFKKGDARKPESPLLSVVRGHIQKDGVNQLHPHEKPIGVLKALLCLSQPATTVLDPFCGIGSTLVAAKDYGLSAIGIEIEERYCEIAARRLAQGVLWGQ